MAVFRDIDSSVRIRGNLTVPTGSITVGNNQITLNYTNGNITAASFSGDGSRLTNLSASNMTGVLLLDGSRAMTGNLVMNDNQIRLRTSIDGYHYISYVTNDMNAVTLDGIRIMAFGGVEIGKANGNKQLAVFREGDIQLKYSTTVSGSLYATTIYENGTSLDSKYVNVSGDTMTGALTTPRINTNGLNIYHDGANNRVDAVGTGTVNFGYSQNDVRWVFGSNSTGSSLEVTGDLKGTTIYENGTSLSSKYALQTTTISAGSGLTGGGSLAANRTLSVDFTTSGGSNGTATTVARGDHNHDGAYLKLTGGTLSGRLTVPSITLNNTNLEQSILQKTNYFVLGNQDWTSLIYSITGGTATYSAVDRGVVLSGISCWIKIRIRMPVDPESTYVVRAKVKKKSGNGTFYIGADSLDANFNSITTDTATSYNYFGALAATITAGQSQYFEGTISGYNLPSEGSPNRFDPEAKYFDLVIIGNYQGTGSPNETVIEWLELYKAPSVGYVGNQKVWHAGNFNPSTKSDTTHNHDSTYLKLIGGTLTGDLLITKPPQVGSIELVNSSDTQKFLRFKDSVNTLGAGIEIVSGQLRLYDNNNGDILVLQPLKIQGNYAWHAGNFDPTTKADKVISILAGNGLTGGGDLSQNRTLSVNFAGTGSATTVARSDHNHDSTYVKLSGGTMTGVLQFGAGQDIAADAVSGVDPTQGIRWSADTDIFELFMRTDNVGEKSGLILSLGDNADDYFQIEQESPSGEATPTKLFKISETLGAEFYTTLKVNGNAVWHAGNDGAGSGLDADLLDGQDGSYYSNIPARLGYTPVNKAGDTMTGELTFSDDGEGITFYGGARIYKKAGGGLVLRRHSANIDPVVESNDGSTSWKIWHAGNDGAGSGLDADLLDGLNSTQFLRSDTSGTLSGDLTLTGYLQNNNNGIRFGNSTWSRNNGEAKVLGEIYDANSTSGNSRLMIHSRLGKVNLYIDGDIYLDEGQYKAWHAGNLSPVTTGDDQSTGNNFTVKGMLYVGNSTTTGDVAIHNGTSGYTIHLDGNSSGKINASTVKVYIKGNGDAEFAGTVTANRLVITDNMKPLVANLNAERLNGMESRDFDTPVTNTEIGGWGVVSGLELKATTPPSSDVLITAGVVYASSGRRFDIAQHQLAQPPASATYDRWDAIYVQGPSEVEGRTKVIQGVASATPVKPTIPADGVLLGYVYKRQNVNDITDGMSGTFDALEDARMWKDVRYYRGSGMEIAGYTKVSGDIYEKGTKLEDKYAELNSDNVFNSNQVINGKVHIKSNTGTLGGNPTDPDYVLRVGYDDSTYIAFDPNEILATGDLSIRANTGNLILGAQSGVVQSDSHMRSSRSAATIAIPAGQVSATWTHNYGNTSYAVSLTPNSFERHVRWTNKTANAITIEIDDPSNQDILVDCILIGY